MLQAGSVVPGGCAVAIRWRLYGDEDGPLRTSPNLSLRYSHGPDGRWTSWRAPCWLLAEKLSPAPDRGSGSCARCALTATTQRAILVPKATECSSTWSRRLSRPGPARETQFSRALEAFPPGLLSLEASAARRPGGQGASGAEGDDDPEAPIGGAGSDESGDLRG